MKTSVTPDEMIAIRTVMELPRAELLRRIKEIRAALKTDDPMLATWDTFRDNVKRMKY